VRLGKYKRSSDSVQREGENLQAVWSPDAKLIAVLVSVAFFDVYFWFIVLMYFSQFTNPKQKESVNEFSKIVL
jgi:uncharacterized membrane protein (DUF485 family)